MEPRPYNPSPLYRQRTIRSCRAGKFKSPSRRPFPYPLHSRRLSALLQERNSQSDQSRRLHSRWKNGYLRPEIPTQVRITLCIVPATPENFVPHLKIRHIGQNGCWKYHPVWPICHFLYRYLSATSTFAPTAQCIERFNRHFKSLISYLTSVGNSDRNLVQRIVQRGMPCFAGFCGVGEKERIPKINDFQDSSAICFRFGWSHLGLNQGLPDYESGALTNWAIGPRSDAMHYSGVCECKVNAFFLGLQVFELNFFVCRVNWQVQN